MEAAVLAVCALMVSGVVGRALAWLAPLLGAATVK
jgi:hypothetical protein